MSGSRAGGKQPPEGKARPARKKMQRATKKA
jgi:hypothetical protein